ncbi:ABC transporter permease [Mycolicibacterium baixiangningiae]|uniref:ABC transporter permease n=1 Tax=Mycolicibacterium baixiangningiae TaxID=2761578 RepID=UPI0018D1F065|nr:ABC transporter permease [Mycolicibacterium baixiangningiae]
MTTAEKPGPGDGAASREAAVQALNELANADRDRTRRDDRRKRAIRLATVVAIGVGFLALWQWATDTGLIHNFIAPSPTEIAAYLPELVTSSYFLDNLSVTLKELLIGFAIGVSAGFLLGVLVSVSSIARAGIVPYVLALNAPPGIVFAPLFLTWFGFGMTSKIAMAVAGAFFPIFISTIAGLAEARNAEADRLMRSLTANERQIFLKVRLPNAVPLIFAGIKLCWISAAIGVVVAEFIGAQAGIGFMVQSFNFQLDIPGVYSLILLLSVSTATVYWLLEFAERKWFSWGRLT